MPTIKRKVLCAFCGKRCYNLHSFEARQYCSERCAQLHRDYIAKYNNKITNNQNRP